MDIAKVLEKLCRAAGVGGRKEITDIAEELLRNYTDDISRDAMGNLLAIRHGIDPHAPTLMLEAHMDEVGMLVTRVDDNGFLYAAHAGRADERVLAAQPVTVYGQDTYEGVFCSVPPHLADGKESAPDLDKMGIDIGMSAQQARECVPPGSRVGFAPHFDRLNENTVSSKALDDRAGMAAILYALECSAGSRASVAVAFCVQEELGCRGAAVAARQIQPTATLVTDVSFAVTPDSDPHLCGKLGGGPMIGISPVLDQGISDRLISLAGECGMAFQTEVMGASTGTDADAISVTGSGIPTGLLSIPERYMHTPVETVDIRDVEAVGKLMAAFVTRWEVD